MATTSYGTPMGMGTQPMGMGMATSGVRNMNLPMSSARPIEVDENTPNLEEIQGFPVAGRTLDGTHFHQDPVTGQMYRMTDEFHDRIPQILADRQRQMGGGTTVTAPTMTNNETVTNRYQIVSVSPVSNVVTLDDFSNYAGIIDNTLDYYPMSAGSYRGNDRLSQEVSLNQNIDTISLLISDIAKYTTPLGDILVQSNQQSLYNQVVTKTPVNNFTNIIPSNISAISYKKYVPINRFINTSTYSSQTFSGYRYNQPINRFF